MSGRNRAPPPLPMKGISHGGIPHPVHEHAFSRGFGPFPHPALLEEFREPQIGWVPNPGCLPPHPAIIEDRLAAQHDEIQGLLVDNQRLAATHVALKQELEAAQYELQRMTQISDSLHPEKDVQIRELYDKSVRLESDIHAVDSMREELSQVNADIKELTAARHDLTSQVQYMSQDLARINADSRQVPSLKVDIENMKQEVQRVRTAIEHEKKGSAENYEHGQVMEQKLITMARELEKLRAEIANAEKRARIVAAANNPGAGGTYIPPHSNPEAVYAAGNPYPINYGMNPVLTGPEGYAQYGYGPTAWGAYGMHQAQGQR
ncbi:hypothetical protein SAY87_010593 [Trapa incisa]|uniref:Protein FLX-like 1 n=1 Tax=Trapa incisa TaxID=236973 RepID=A0AAN7GES6_9MYRT|nr:hypothetical protein SAY87_010593 [Trapa incisa]